MHIEPIQPSPRLGAQPARDGPEFSSHRRRMAGALCVALTGELDRTGVPAAACARHHHGRVVLRCGRSCVRRLFERTGVDRSLELTDDWSRLGASP